MALRHWLGVAAAAACLTLPASAGAAVSLEPVGSFSSPVFVTSDPTDPDRLFVVEQAGQIRLLEDGTQSTYLNLNSPTDFVIGGSGNERGLLSMAFSPDFETSGRFFVYYTRTGTGNDAGDIQIDEFTAATPDADTVSQTTRRAVLTVTERVSQTTNHNGGQLQFGPDGYLYAAVGDGGGAGDPFEAAQNRSSLMGKLLRIDPDQSGSDPYTVPADNPFVGVAGADEVWSFGLRNPWRFSFDRLTGDLLLGDVGQGSWEEIDYAQAPNAGRGLNFGWDCREGRHNYEVDVPGDPNDCILPFTEPILEYANPPTSAASVTGGYVVRDASLEELYGRYLYADVYEGVIRSLVPGIPDASGARSEGLAVSFPVSFGEDSCSRVYVAGSAAPPANNVFRFTDGTPADCSPQPPQRTLTVTVEGDGTVTGEGIDCPGDCTETVDDGTSISLAAEPGPDSIFSGWGSDCSGTGSCNLAMSADRAVSATFTHNPPPLPFCRGVEATIVAEAGTPVTGTEGDDVVVGTEGDDEIAAGEGADLVCSGEGADSVKGGAGADELKGNKGPDSLGGGPGPDSLSGGPGGDTCNGGSGRDRFQSC